jgi:hypothetical protein
VSIISGDGARAYCDQEGGGGGGFPAHSGRPGGNGVLANKDVDFGPPSPVQQSKASRPRFNVDWDKLLMRGFPVRRTCA